MRFAFTCVLAVLAAMSIVDRAHAFLWESVGPQGGRVDGFAQSMSSPDRMYVIPIQLGVWRSDDRGENWERIEGGVLLDQRFERVAVSPVDEDIVLIVPVDGDSVLRSTNGGSTWTPFSVAVGLGKVNAIDYAPWDASLVLLASEVGGAPGVHRSTDGGMTWAPSNSGLSTLNPKTIAFDPVTAGTVLTGTEQGVFRSTDSGASWTAMSTSGNGAVNAIAYSSANPSRIWAGRGTAELLRSDDGGASFPLSPGQASCEMFSTRCDPLLISASSTDPNVALTYILQDQPYQTEYGVFSLFKNHLHRSTNGGVSWQFAAGFRGPIVSLGEDREISSKLYAAIAYGQSAFENGQGFSDGPGLHRSTNGGSTWQPWPSEFTGLSIHSVQFDGESQLYARSANESLKMTSGGAWQGMQIAEDRGALRVDRKVNGTLYNIEIISDDVVCSISTNGGQSWGSGYIEAECDVPYLVSEDAESGFEHFYFWAERWDCQVGNEIVGSTLWYRTGSGFEFDSIELDFFAAAAAVSSSDWMTIYSIERDAPGLVRLSTNAGASWVPRSTGLPSDPGVQLFLVDGTSGPTSDQLTVVFRNAGAYRSLDDGLSWNPVPLAGLGSAAVVAADWDPATDRFFLATEDDGAYVSDVGFINDGLPTRDLNSVSFDAATNSIALGTEHASAWMMSLDVGVAAPEVASAPTPLDLRAMPNPFASSVRLEFSLPSTARSAVLAVYDVSGRRIATLASGARASGAHAFTWDGRNQSGARVPAGVYFARLESDGDVAAKRIVLLGE